MIIGFGSDMPQFQRITALPAEYADAVNLQTTFGLPDRGGVLRVTHVSGNEVDALNYSKVLPQAAYSSLATAKNPYIADSLMDSLAMRNPLYSVSRESYGGAAEGSSSAEGAGVGISDPGIEPEPSGRAVVGSFTLWRGRKVYELKNHLGNVLAVVSDVKIGVGPVNTLPSLIDYYTADPSSSLRAGVVEMSDYAPFGMLLAKRHWVSGEGYRFGFQAQEGDDEWSGEGNMLAFKYRVHDARLGRFLSIDPLAPEYPWNSPYAFSENRVIDSRELEGLERLQSTTYYRKRDGKWQDVSGPVITAYSTPRSMGSGVEFVGVYQIENPDGSLNEIGRTRCYSEYPGVYEPNPIRGLTITASGQDRQDGGWKYGADGSRLGTPPSWLPDISTPGDPLNIRLYFEFSLQATLYFGFSEVKPWTMKAPLIGGEYSLSYNKSVEGGWDSNWKVISLMDSYMGVKIPIDELQLDLRWYPGKYGGKPGADHGLRALLGAKAPLDERNSMAKQLDAGLRVGSSGPKEGYLGGRTNYDLSMGVGLGVEFSANTRVGFVANKPKPTQAVENGH